MATAPGTSSELTLPSTRFHGSNAPDLICDPIMNTGVVPPSGIFHCANPITTGVASATPLTDSARNRFCSSSTDGSSKHLVPTGMIQRSAFAWSIMVVTMCPNPR